MADVVADVVADLVVAPGALPATAADLRRQLDTTDTHHRAAQSASIRAWSGPRGGAAAAIAPDAPPWATLSTPEIVRAAQVSAREIVDAISHHPIGDDEETYYLLQGAKIGASFLGAVGRVGTRLIDAAETGLRIHLARGRYEDRVGRSSGHRRHGTPASCTAVIRSSRTTTPRPGSACSNGRTVRFSRDGGSPLTSSATSPPGDTCAEDPMTASSSREATFRDVEAYVALARALLRGELSAPQYESAFFALFRRQDFVLPPDLFAVMQELFFAAEDYVDDDRLRDAGELDARGLRSRIASIEPRLAALAERLPR